MSGNPNARFLIKHRIKLPSMRAKMQRKQKSCGWNIEYIYIYIPGTQMTIVLVGEDLVLDGLSLKIEDKRSRYIYIICSIPGTQILRCELPATCI